MECGPGQWPRTASRDWHRYAQGVLDVLRSRWAELVIRTRHHWPGEAAGLVVVRDWPGVAIQIWNGEHAGRIVVPANHSLEKDGYAAHAMLSDDGGENWRMSSVIAPASNESQVVELAHGRLMMNSRNQSFTNDERTGYRAIAFSGDGGETWTPPQPDAHLGARSRPA